MPNLPSSGVAQIQKLSLTNMLLACLQTRQLNPPRRESLVRLSLPSGQLYETLNTRSDHMFVTFKGDSELLLENTLEHARQEIEKKIFPLWPHGAETQFRGSDWIVRFRNAPWNMSGPDVALYVFLPRLLVIPTYASAEPGG
jgi:hypothetical protein